MPGFCLFCLAAGAFTPWLAGRLGRRFSNGAWRAAWGEYAGHDRLVRRDLRLRPRNQCAGAWVVSAGLGSNAVEWADSGWSLDVVRYGAVVVRRLSGPCRVRGWVNVPECVPRMTVRWPHMAAQADGVGLLLSCWISLRTIASCRFLNHPAWWAGSMFVWCFQRRQAAAAPARPVRVGAFIQGVGSWFVQGREALRRGGVRFPGLISGVRRLRGAGVCFRRSSRASYASGCCRS